MYYTYDLYINLLPLLAPTLPFRLLLSLSQSLYPWPPLGFTRSSSLVWRKKKRNCKSSKKNVTAFYHLGDDVMTW